MKTLTFEERVVRLERALKHLNDLHSCEMVRVVGEPCPICAMTEELRS